MSVHTSRNGQIVECHAPPGKCPLGGDHYDSVTEAEAALEEKMSDSMFSPGDSAREKVDPSKMKMSELNQAVKDTTDSAILDEGVSRGSNRTHKNLLKNDAVTSEQLKELRDKSEDSEVRKLALHHKNYAASNMTVDEFAEVATKQNVGYGGIKKSVLDDDSVDDERLEAYVNYSQKMRGSARVDAALSNPNNKLSDQTVAKYAARGWGETQAASSAGRLNADQVESLPDNSIYWGNVDRESSPEALEGYTRWSVREHKPGAYWDKGEQIAHRVAANPNTSAESLEKLGNAGLASRDVYAHPNTSENVKKRLRENDPEVARTARIMDLEKKHGNLREQLVVSSNVSRPYNGAPYSTTTIKLDKDKVKEYNLSREEVNDILGARGYNVRAGYNPESGTFVGEVDSSG